MDVITVSNFHKFLKGAESGPKSARVGRGYQDQAFVVGTGYKVSDGVLDGSFGGVTHTAKGIVLGDYIIKLLAIEYNCTKFQSTKVRN